MKRAALLLLLLFLTGCSLAPDAYRSVTPHAGTSDQTENPDAVVVETYGELKQAILSFVEAGITDGTIRAVNYDGDVEEDLADAAYEVAKLEPLGAYAVDYMTHDCTLIVSYYEIGIHITFRRTVREIAAIQPVSTRSALITRVEEAAAGLRERVTLEVSGYWEPDIPALVENYCDAHPDTMLERPQVTVSVYPDSGFERIVEVNFSYLNQPETLRSMVTEVRDAVHNAAEYIRYRQTDREKLALLFTFLTERFPYAAGKTVTPLYDALCTGTASDVGLATAWQLICDEAGMECYTVEGLYQGESHIWNVVGLDGEYRHLDLARSVLEDEALRLYTDLEMTGYYWKPELAPACILTIEPQDTPAEEPPEEETPEETEPNPEEESPEA